jgi:hypothetical protein
MPSGILGRSTIEAALVITREQLTKLETAK